MSEKVFRVEIVTPDKVAYCGEVSLISLPGVEGQLGILAGHARLLAMLDPGVTSYVTSDNERHSIVTGAGFVRVSDNLVSVLVESAEGAKEAGLALGKSAVECFDSEELRQARLLQRARQRLVEMKP